MDKVGLPDSTTPQHKERALQNMCCLPVHIPKGSSRGENDKQYDRQEKETFEGGVDLYFPVDEVII